MSKTAKRIPISDAKAIGEKCGYNQVIIVAWDGNTGTTSVCTWGKSLNDCDLAAKGGNFVKKALGWPDELCHEKPARIKRLDKVKVCPDCGGKDIRPYKDHLCCYECGNYFEIQSAGRAGKKNS